MRIISASILASSAACLLMAAPASAADCRDRILQMAQQYHLSLSPTTPGPGAGGKTAEAPATTESRGLTAGPDSLTSSGGTLPPSTSSPPADQHDASPMQLGAADRAKVEGLVSEARAAGEHGRAQECQRHLEDARAILRQGRE